MSAWVSVKERLPGDGETVLIYRELLANQGWDAYLVNMVAWLDCDNNPPDWIVDGEALKNVTHWMPLPEPPEAAK